MKVTRRDLLVWSAGAAAGLMVTPVPWKLLDDTSIWSQNWPWIPQPAHGPVDVKLSACTLCPNGCAMKVKMAAGWLVGLAGVISHPVSRGALCPLGFGAHQLNWHPQRLRTIRHGANASSWNAARTAFAKACSEGPVVIIDGYPGRAASSILQGFAQKQKGEYRIVFGPVTRGLAPYEAWSGVPASALGYDLENARTIVSFGAPLLDGWGSPGRFTRLWAERAAGMADPQLRLIQVEPSLSRTAGRAWQWVPVSASAESALAAGIARVLIEERIVSARGPLPPVTLDQASAQTGLSVDAIRSLARTIVARTPAVAIASDNNPAIAAVNVVLGAVGTRGGIVPRSKQAEPYATADVPIKGARAVLIDASVPWEFTPQTDAEVFRFAAWMEERSGQSGCFRRRASWKNRRTFRVRLRRRLKPMRWLQLWQRLRMKCTEPRSFLAAPILLSAPSRKLFTRVARIFSAGALEHYTRKKRFTWRRSSPHRNWRSSCGRARYGLAKRRTPRRCDAI